MQHLREPGHPATRGCAPQKGRNELHLKNIGQKIIEYPSFLN
jgi:hypothetical protein